jgi:TRAP-type C4-dicarboxylate transport system permease small subunit
MQSTASPALKISFLWTFVALNIVFADVLGLYTPGVLPQVMNGVVEGVQLSEELMLIAAVFIQIPVAMIVLTQFLPTRVNMILNVIAVVVTTVFVIGGGSLKLHYIFFASCEVIAMIAILYQVRRLRVSNEAPVV